MDGPKLSTYPYVIVRVSCPSCKRHGSYRLARLAARFGPEMLLTEVLAALSADCPGRGIKHHKGSYPVCGIMLPDLRSPTPPDVPPAVGRPGGLRVVGGKG